MKRTLNIAALLTIFGIIFWIYALEHKASFVCGVLIFMLSFIVATGFVTGSEMYKLDKEVAEDNKQYTELYTNPKTTSMIDQNDSLED